MEKGSGASGAEVAGAVSRDAIRKIAETKLEDLNAADIEGAMKIIEGTARSMGLTVRG